MCCSSKSCSMRTATPQEAERYAPQVDPRSHAERQRERSRPAGALGARLGLTQWMGSGLLFFIFIRPQPYTCLGIECSARRDSGEARAARSPHYRSRRPPGAETDGRTIRIYTVYTVSRRDLAPVGDRRRRPRATIRDPDTVINRYPSTTCLAACTRCICSSSRARAARSS